MLSKRLVGVPLNNFNIGHRFARELADLRQSEGLVVAVSGGADSLALLLLLCKWRNRIKIPMAVAHVHHGRSDRVGARYRLRAERFVRDWAERLKLPLYLVPRGQRLKMKRALRSEEELRDWRWRHLEKAKTIFARRWRVKNVWVATAHTAEDQLETRLMRLIRGTGPEGILAMKKVSQEKWRPLLDLTKSDLVEWLSKNEIQWLEDPSNRSEDPLRNWLRQRWLTALENRQKGAVRNFARSLERLAHVFDVFATLPSTRSSQDPGRISRQELQGQSVVKKRLRVAQFLREEGLREFSQNHLDEILKRLDKTRGISRFKLLGQSWLIDASGIATSRE